MPRKIHTVRKKALEWVFENSRVQFRKLTALFVSGVPKNRQLVLLGEEKDYSIWHRRFMYYNPKIVKKTIAKYLEMDAKVPSDDCPTCVKSKMVYSKQSRVHKRRSAKPFEKLHIDGGEFPVKSISENFYYVIFQDDYTDYIWISCVDSKAKFITEIKKFLEYVNTQ
jgi:hypothetical protein